MPWQGEQRVFGCACVCVCVGQCARVCVGEGMTIGDSVALVHTKISACFGTFIFFSPDPEQFFPASTFHKVLWGNMQRAFSMPFLFFPTVCCHRILCYLLLWASSHGIQPQPDIDKSLLSSGFLLSELHPYNTVIPSVSCQKWWIQCMKKYALLRRLMTWR